MNSLSPKIFIICIILPLLGWIYDKDPSAKQIIKNVQKKLEDVQVIEAEFSQTFYWSLAEEEEQNSGKIYIGNSSPTDCFGWEIGLDFIDN